MLSKILTSKVIGWFRKKSNNHAERSEGKLKWIIGVILTIMAMSVAAYIALRAYRQGKELAKLKHQRDVTNAKIELEKVNKDLAENEKKVQNSRDKIIQLAKKSSKLDDKLSIVKEKWEIENAKVRALENWEDIDAYLRAMPRNRDRSSG